MPTADAVNGRTVSVVRVRDGLPAAVRVTACETCAEAVAARVAPPEYGDFRPDDRGDPGALRAMQPPPRTVVGPAERSGPCAECGRPVRAAGRHTPATYLDML